MADWLIRFFAFLKENYPDVVKLYTSAEADNITAINYIKEQVLMMEKYLNMRLVEFSTKRYE